MAEENNYAVFLVPVAWEPRYWSFPPRELEICMLKTEGGPDECEYPGGHQKKGETLFQTGIRKTQEETGLEVIEVIPHQIYREIFGKTVVVGYPALVKPKKAAEITAFIQKKNEVEKATKRKKKHVSAGWYSKPEDVPWTEGAPDSLFEEFAKTSAAVAAYRKEKLGAFFLKVKEG
ncbi:NUDIX domain-containing protein [Shimazuella sp. AN120528]|uniref:NUDIX domain-containing protein n=1 Tax=Shimazuella soli TaxID=1892854 RepID=UPI001F104D53|nr:NUDIX domain-containing protein [Shimazuella soli]MCH5584802.1 NUDIX domain-containing protein [Shimazuella soli]